MALQANPRQSVITKMELRKSEAMLKKLRKQTRELKTTMKSKRKKQSKDDMSIDSVVSNDTDTDY